MAANHASPGRAAAPVRPDRLPADAPMRWLALGWDDLRATRFRGLFYGLVFALMVSAIEAVYRTQWQLTMGLTAGFLLVGPFVCAGLYELSRQRERGEPPGLGSSLTCWRRNPGALAFFAALLTFVMVVWARVSVVLFALAATTALPTLDGLLAQLASPDNLAFLALWMSVGSVFAALVFSISVVSVPLMLDQRVDALAAVFASVRATVAQPAALLAWAATIVALVVPGLVLWKGLLVVTTPWVGHASWHAYRALLAAAPPAR